MTKKITINTSNAKSIFDKAIKVLRKSKPMFLNDVAYWIGTPYGVLQLSAKEATNSRSKKMKWLKKVLNDTGVNRKVGDLNEDNPFPLYVTKRVSPIPRHSNIQKRNKMAKQSRHQRGRGGL